MGLMGEKGAEAIMPLANVGGKLRVHVMQTSANDSGNCDKEQLDELKKQTMQLANAVEVLQAGFKLLLEENKKQSESLDYIERKMRLNTTRQNTSQVAV
jgi:hypothetical protein